MCSAGVGSRVLRCQQSGDELDPGAVPSVAVVPNISCMEHHKEIVKTNVSPAVCPCPQVAEAWRLHVVSYRHHSRHACGYAHGP